MRYFSRTPRHATALALAALIAAGTFAATDMQSAASAAPVPEGGYVDVIRQVAPAVVTIEVDSTARVASFDRDDFPQGFPFEEFQRRFGLPDSSQAPVVRGLGTGFIISEDGQVVTNAHVVKNAKSITVTLPDGREFDGEIVGMDEATDIALVSIDGKDLPTVSFGDSDALEVGAPVIAIGNPLGLGSTVTTGIVSALGRDINAGPFDNFIQTDAAINRGNSGGPLFNEAGEVVGVNSMIMTPNGGSVGLGFAVPASTASRIVADLAGDGTVERGWLGVMISPVSDEVATVLGLEKARGAIVAEVTDDAPADKAGLRKGDIVVSVNGQEVDDPRDLTRLIAGDHPGSKVELGVLRSGREISVDVTLGNRADQAA